jgi:hypothetical protein
MHLSKALDTEPALGLLPQDSQGDWDDINAQFESLGRRLDRVREIIETTGQHQVWRLTYWAKVQEELSKRWALLRTLESTGQRTVQVKPPKVRYDWWEATHEVEFVEFPLLKWFENKFLDAVHGNHLQHELDKSWDKAREESYQKARQGLS